MPAPRLFDFHAARLKARRARRLNGDTFLLQAAADGMAERLAPVARRFTHGLWLGQTVPPVLAPMAASWSCASFDATEFLDVPMAGFDLALSLYSLQTVNDLTGALVQIRRALRPDGLFLGALFAGATLRELRDSFAFAESETLGGISPRVAPFGDVRDLGGLLQRAGFALPVADLERTLLRYGDFDALVQDLRAHGQTNALAERDKRFLPRRTRDALIAHYTRHHSAGGKLNATFETIYLTGWSPHESQQQPLKPGSALARLSDALGTVERSAGEKPS